MTMTPFEEHAAALGVELPAAPPDEPLPLIEWTAPPPLERGWRSEKWATLLAPFREKPGVWGKLPGDYARGMPGAIKGGRLGGASPGEFDATYRKAGHRCEVWVKYLGGES